MSQKRCTTTKDDGERCRGWAVCEEHSACYVHDPCREEERAEARQRGGEATARKHQQAAQQLVDEDLPPLETHEDAKKFLDVVGRGVVTGRVGTREAQAAIRAVEAWLKAAGEHEVAHNLEDIAERLQTVEKDLKDRKRPRVEAVP